MNQDILFPDLQQWDSQRQVVMFPAQQGGALIECVVSREWLQQQSGFMLRDETAILECFASMRFDLEEQAEVLIEDEAFNDAGEIELG